MASSQNVDYTDLHRLVCSIFAHFYKDYFSTVIPPANIRLDYIIPLGEIFTEAIGTYMLYKNRKLSGKLSGISEVVVDHMDHSEHAFTSYVIWRSKKINFKRRSSFGFLCCLVFHLVLQYFKNGCFKFSGLAAEVVFDIIKDNEILLNGLTKQFSFETYKKYCHLYCQSSQKVSSLEPDDYEHCYIEFPKDLLSRDKTSTEEIPGDDATTESKSSIVLLKPKQKHVTKSSDQVSNSNSSSLTDRQTRRSTGAIFACKFCIDDCRDFLGVFVSSFKTQYCMTD